MNALNSIEFIASLGFSLSNESIQNIANAHRYGKVVQIKDELDRTMAVAFLAMINDASLRRILNFRISPSRPYEWNEGSIALVTEMYLSHSYRLHAMWKLIAQLRQYESVVYFRNGNLKCFGRAKLYLSKNHGA